MTTPVITSPSQFRLASCYVNEPVSSAHLGRLADEISFLNGNVVNTVCSAHITKVSRGSVDPKTYRAFYYRSAAARVLRIEVQLHTSGEKCTLTTTLPSGAAWIQHNGLDGSIEFTEPPIAISSPHSIVGFVDVTGCSLGPLLELSIRVDKVASSLPEGIARLSIIECPLAAVDPFLNATSEPVIETSWTVAGNRLVNGANDGSTSHGMARINFVMDQARRYHRKHFNLVGVEQSGVCDWRFSVATGIFGMYGYATPSGGYRWELQQSDLYAGSDETWKCVIRYKTADATSWDLITNTRDTAGSGVNTTTTNLAGTSGAWVTSSFDLTIPISATDGIVVIDWANNNTTSAVDVATIAVIETQG